MTFTKGYKPTLAHREKLRQAKLKNPVRYWLGKKRPEMALQNARVFTGKITKEETKLKLHNIHIALGTTPPHFTGEQSSNWKGDKSGYGGMHKWLYTHYGSAYKCENRENSVLAFECTLTSNTFQYAKRKESKYTRDITDYFQLCVSCHVKYDKNK